MKQYVYMNDLENWTNNPQDSNLQLEEDTSAMEDVQGLYLPTEAISSTLYQMLALCLQCRLVDE